MTPTLGTHVKHIVIAVLAVGCVIAGIVIYEKYQAAIVERMAARDEKISQNQVAVAQAQKANQVDQGSITARDAANAQQVAFWQAKALQALTPAQADALIAQRLANFKPVQGQDAQGNATTTVSTANLADFLNKADVAQHVCDSNLGTCEADKATLNGIIARDADIQKTDQGTIKLQGDQIKDLQKFQVPRWTLMAGVGKTQGTNFNDANSYQPVIGIDYRLTNRFGVFGLAQNKSAAFGLSWRFGSLPK
jgi:hypothetical protein